MFEAVSQLRLWVVSPLLNLGRGNAVYDQYGCSLFNCPFEEMPVREE